MNKIVVTAAITGVLLIAALLFPYSTSDGFTHKGLPFGYYKTVDTHGLCVGFIDEKNSDMGSCDKRSFPLNYSHLCADLAILGVLAIALVYFTEGKNLTG